MRAEGWSIRTGEMRSPLIVLSKATNPDPAAPVPRFRPARQNKNPGARGAARSRIKLIRSLLTRPFARPSGV
jgi:hypothetical protein